MNQLEHIWQKIFGLVLLESWQVFWFHWNMVLMKKRLHFAQPHVLLAAWESCSPASEGPPSSLTFRQRPQENTPWAVASSPNVGRPGGGCPRLWFFGGPMLSFAWEFLCEVSSHQKDTCATQERVQSFALCSSQARCCRWREVSLPKPAHVIPATAPAGCKVPVSHLLLHENCSLNRVWLKETGSVISRISGIQELLAWVMRVSEMAAKTVVV